MDAPQPAPAAEATLPPTPFVTAPAKPVASVKLLTGADAGALVPLTKAETTIGRPGIQVAAIVKRGNSFFLKHIEGQHAPLVNNQAIPDGGTELANGDVIEIAGRKIEFVARVAPNVAEESAGASTIAESAAPRP